MKHVKKFENYLFESSTNIDDIYNKYYSDINKSDFDSIIDSDPTTIIGVKLGKYSKWLLNLYRKRDLKLEDLYKASEFLTIFDKNKHKIQTGFNNNDINNVRNLVGLYQVIKPFITDFEPTEIQERKNKCHVKDFQNYDLYIPETFEDCKILGSNTQWASAGSKEWFDRYLENGALYILISKTNHKEKYQFHFGEKEFIDRIFKNINLDKFYEENQDIKEYFKKQNG